MAASVPTLDLYNMIGGIGDVLARRNDVANAQQQATYQQGLTQALLDPNGVPPTPPAPQSFLQRLIGGIGSGLGGEQPAAPKVAPAGPAGAPAAAPSTTATVPGAAPAQSAYGMYRQAGLPDTGARAVIAGLMGEAGTKLDPTATNNLGTEAGGAINPNGAFGVAQWNGSRQEQLLNFARQTGGNPRSADTQHKFVVWEMQHNYPDVWQAMNDPNLSPQDKLAAFVNRYENPKDKAGAIAQRTQYLANDYGNAAPTQTAAPAQSVGTQVTPNGHVIPDYSLPRINAMISNPATKVLGEALLKRYMDNAATGKWEAPTRDDLGNVVQRNTQTGEVKVLSGAKSPITLSEGQTAFDPVTGKQIAAGNPKQEIENKNLQREAEADRLGLKGEDRTQYIVNGRIPTGAEKQTGEQANAATFATRMFESNKILSDPAIYGAGLGVAGVASGISSAIPGIGNMLVPEKYQMYDQAKRDFVNAVLRKESGAAISQSEFDNADKQYFPRPGDSAKVIAQKEKNRDTAIRVIANSASPSFREQFFGTKNPEIVKRGEARKALPPNTTPAMIVKDAKIKWEQWSPEQRAKASQMMRDVGIDPAKHGIE